MTDRWRHREPETLRMNFQNRPLGWALLPERIRGMFNLNDPRWGRGDDKSDDAPGPPRPPRETPAAGPQKNPAPPEPEGRGFFWGKKRRRARAGQRRQWRRL